IAGAQVEGAIVICNRGDVTAAQIGAPPRFESLVTVGLSQWPAEKCELCARDIPVNTDVGHGAQYIKAAMKNNAK
ncbi:MAG TPA: phosphoribosyltransferase, partial [Candidatus Paceibacterota bacterium]